jgi:hypothetical protein
MKVRSSYVAAAALGLVLCGTLLTSPVSAATVFTAQLTGSQQVPPVSTSAFGTATFTLNDAMTALTFQATINGIDLTGTQTVTTDDNLISAHIHAPAPPGANAPVVFGFFGDPFNNTSPNDTVIMAFTNSVGGTVSATWNASEGNNTTLTAQLPNLLAGLAYINFHTVRFPMGELRGQIQIVPGPIAGAGLPTLIALGGFVWARRRKAAATA